ncbi:MAG: recombination protein RecR [Acidobacteriota bacterium]|nr:MAG: recombination protein RecR [Acidobacteriota bacterium]
MRALERLVAHFEKLPGVGRKTAERFAYHLLSLPPKDIEGFSKSLLDLKSALVACRKCGGYGESDPCAVCSDPGRASDLLCVVGNAGAAVLIERTGRYRGLYHILGGPLTRSSRSTGPRRTEPRLKALLARIEKTPPREVLLAFPASAEGEATAASLSRMLKPLGLRVTRLGVGLPVGSELEYADEATLARSLDSRRKL